MIFLAITPAGLVDALRAAKVGDAVWCGSDAITESEYAILKRADLTRFSYALGDQTLIADAVRTIEEHHPGHTVWVETSAQAG